GGCGHTGPSVAEVTRRKQRTRRTYFVTEPGTSSLPSNAPSSATACNVYVPGSVNVAWTTIFPSFGSTGGVHSGAHGEFMPVRVSSQLLTCSGENVTLPAPR